jgi:hypothetical protein
VQWQQNVFIMANKSNEVAVDVSFAALQITAKQFMGKI